MDSIEACRHSKGGGDDMGRCEVEATEAALGRVGVEDVDIFVAMEWSSLVGIDSFGSLTTLISLETTDSVFALDRTKIVGVGGGMILESSEETGKVGVGLVGLIVESSERDGCTVEKLGT